MSVDARYALLLRVAREAGRLAHDFWIRRGALTVELKGPQDFVSVADRDVETFIRGEIARAFPGDHFLGEETAASFSGNAEHLWIVDPIDGTHNFLRGIPYWNVSIAYVEAGVRTLGAVNDPAHAASFFMRRRGGGAWRSTDDGDARIEAADTTSLAGSIVAVGHSDRAPDPRYLELRRALMDAGAAFRNFRLRRVAARACRRWSPRCVGQLELSSWDAMAGLLLVEEAGGRAAPFPGRGGFTVRAPVVASAAGLAGALSALVQQATAGG